MARSLAADRPECNALKALRCAAHAQCARPQWAKSITPGDALHYIYIYIERDTRSCIRVSHARASGVVQGQTSSVYLGLIGDRQRGVRGFATLRIHRHVHRRWQIVKSLVAFLQKLIQQKQEDGVVYNGLYFDSIATEQWAHDWKYCDLNTNGIFHDTNGICHGPVDVGSDMTRARWRGGPIVRSMHHQVL
jgi:hypothetical protein